MALPLAACGSGASPAPTSTTTVAGETRLTGSVALFLPNDGFTVSQDVPLNSWHDFADATKDSLEDRGFEADHVQTHADSDLERQSHRIQDYVVDALDGSTDGSSADPEAQSTTLVVAPAAPMTDTVKRYGDYVTQSLAEENATDESLDESLSRMTRALGLAKKAGMHVVVVATPLPRFTPDAFVSLCSAREIGRLQARQLVSKLQLDSASRYNPKYIEILLPYDADSDYPQLDEAFAREAFNGVWEVIGPYFRSGVVLSPSMRTTASTTVQDWRDVTIKATDADSIEMEFRQRLGRPANGQGHVRIDGVIAMNDYVANGVVKGYSDTIFKPTQDITREQLAAILYRYAQLKGYDTSKRADLSVYTDAGDISAYALEAMQWAVAEELISGVTSYTLVPSGRADRAQVAMILMRFCERIVPAE